MTAREAIERLKRDKITTIMFKKHYPISGNLLPTEHYDLAISALEKQILNRHSKLLKWIKCTRKNGTEFLKLIYYSPDAQGYIELGRFNMTKREMQNNDWSLPQILKELE